MSFFWTEAKKQKPRKVVSIKRDNMPVESMQRLGCEVCPRAEDWDNLRTPKMRPTGDRNPVIYLLGTGPNEDEDDEGKHWVGQAGRALLSKMPRSLKQSMRAGHITQCMPPIDKDSRERDLNVKWPEIECCRSRVIVDIEESKPEIIVGVGDKVLQWATGLEGGATTLTWRGQPFPVKIGKHSCWFYPIMYPNWAFSEQKWGKNPYELALEHDFRALEYLVKHGRPPKLVERAEIDRNITQVTGTEAGDFQRLERLLADLSGLPSTGLDIETNCLRPWRAPRWEKPSILTCAIGTVEQTVAFAVEHPHGWGSDIRISKVHGLLAEFLLFSNSKIAHNLAMELEWFNFFYGPQSILGTDWDDSMAMCHSLDERPGTKSLDVQTLLGFGFLLKAQSRVDVSKPKWWLTYPLPDILRYNGLDAKWTHARAQQLLPILDEDPLMRAEYERKVKLAPALVLTEAQGLPVSVRRAEKLHATYEERLKGIEDLLFRCNEIKKFRDKFGRRFNPAASDDVVKLLKDVCKRDEVRQTNRDGSITDSGGADILESIPRAEVPSAHLIVEHRAVSKQQGTYLEPVINGKMLSDDGLVHSKYSSMVAVTGRLAAEDPNAQNWSKRKFKEVRGIFYADDDEEIVACDYGQIEFRVAGMASEDKNLVKYCWTGYDVHKFWAERMVKKYGRIKDIIVDEFEVDWDKDGLKTLRQETKNKWVFPSIFGASVKSRSANLHLPLEIAEDLDEEFWGEFPGVKRWQERLIARYEKTLYVETLGGRRRRGPMTKNEIINHPIQGTACDIVTEAHVALSHRAYLEDRWELQPRLNVHDDLSTWLKKKTRDERIRVIVREMCMHRFSYINVPLVVEVSTGPDWASLHEIAKYRSDQLFNLRNPYQ